MNWLQKIASKEDFLFNKYRKISFNLYKKYFRAKKSSDSLALINNASDQILKSNIRTAISWNPRYADWLIGCVYSEYLLLAERFPERIPLMSITQKLCQ